MEPVAENEDKSEIYRWAYRLSKAFIWLFNLGVVVYGLHLLYSLN